MRREDLEEHDRRMAFGKKDRWNRDDFVYGFWIALTAFLVLVFLAFVVLDLGIRIGLFRLLWGAD